MFHGAIAPIAESKLRSVSALKRKQLDDYAVSGKPALLRGVRGSRQLPVKQLGIVTWKLCWFKVCAQARLYPLSQHHCHLHLVDD